MSNVIKRTKARTYLAAKDLNTGKYLVMTKWGSLKHNDWKCSYVGFGDKIQPLGKSKANIQLLLEATRKQLTNEELLIDNTVRVLRDYIAKHPTSPDNGWYERRINEELESSKNKKFLIDMIPHLSLVEVNISIEETETAH